MVEVNRRRVVNDPPEILVEVARTADLSGEVVGHLVTAIREAVDELLAEGHVVVTGELFVSLGDSPTWQAVREKLRGDAAIPTDVLRGDGLATADWLDLPLGVYVEHALANRPHVVARTLDIMRAPDSDADLVWDVLEAWDATFTDDRAYKVGNAGLEMAAERWLIDHLPRLRLHGFPVELVHQQLILPSGKRLDLLCRFNDRAEAAEIDDWLIIELKVTRFYPEAANQVLGYAAEVRDELVRDSAVYPLLITDGATHTELTDLGKRGVRHISLAALGYRQHLAQERLGVDSSSIALNSQKSRTGHLPADVTANDRSDNFDGPETYWVRLYWDRTGGLTDDAVERASALRLWRAREARRERYERDWGADPSGWPAQHPTTVLAASGTPWPRVAVCIRCDWLTRPPDLANVDLREAAKEHALAYAHDQRLEHGEDPTPRVGGVAEAIDRARRAARRVKRR